MKIAIIKDAFFEKHSASWANSWISYCEQKNLGYELIDWRQVDAFKKILQCNVLVWHFSHYSALEMTFARSILYSARMAGLAVFPDFPDAWHFDDKVAQVYALQALESPVPENYVFYDYSELSSWVADRDHFPLVAKLKSGSGSYNVQMIKTRAKVLKYGKRMLKGKGFAGTPSLGLKAKSNLMSSKNMTQILARIKRTPEFIYTLRQAKSLPKEKGYVYFQEYIENDGFDIKVVVVGNKLGFIGRKNRKNDFRASGGGSLFFDKAVINQQLIDIAFNTSDRLGCTCMGYDFVISSKTHQPFILEISYGFSHLALLESGGYFDRAGTWHDKPLNAPEEVLALLVGNAQ